MSSEVWTEFWKTHARESAGRDPQHQVLRTLGGQPIEVEAFEQLVEGMVLHLDLSGGERVLDLCCGNGLVARPLAERAREVVGVDISPEFIQQVNGLNVPNLTGLVGSALDIEFESGRFDRIVIFAAVQYFSLSETVRLLQRCALWLAPGGKLFLADVPDLTHMWKFFNTPDRERAHFEALARGSSIIGTWFDREWLRRAASFAGFGVEILDQPAVALNSHCRFDMILSLGEAP